MYLPHISETNRARKSKFCTQLDRAKYSFDDENFFAGGRAGGAAPPKVNLGPLISRKLVDVESSNSTHISIAAPLV